MSNTATAIKQNRSTPTMLTTFASIKIWFRNEKYEEGIQLSEAEVLSVWLHDDIMSMLPTAKIVIVDSNRFFNTVKLKVGETMYVQLTPVAKTNGNADQKPYIDTRMKILDIQSTPNFKAEKTKIEITCCYDALKLLSYAGKYETPLPLALVGESSTQVLSSLISSAGLAPTAEVTTIDVMNWINGTLPLAQFISKVRNHSWISEDDAMIIYTTIDGNAHISSVKHLAQKDSITNLVSGAKQKARPALESKNCLIFENVSSIDEATGLTTLGKAYKQISYVYTPLGELGLVDLTEFKEADSIVPGLNGITFAPGYRQVTYSNPETAMAANTNKIADLYEMPNTITDAGMHFIGTHDHYDVAPKHNSAVISSFFQTGFSVVINLSEQEPMAATTAKLPRVGDKVYVDASGEMSDNQIYSGEYIVGAISYNIANNGDFNIRVTLLSDGYYGNGQINKV